MTALRKLATPLVAGGIAWEPTGDNQWTVWTNGDRSTTRTITQEGTRFIAWVGFRDERWNFHQALQSCADDIRYRREEAAAALAAHEEAIASLMRMTAAEKARLIAKLEDEKALLDYTDLEVDALGRKALLDRQIARLREFA